MDYKQTLLYLYEKLPTYHHIGKNAYKPGLQNIIDICNEIGNPHRKIKTIHIAGTNGKGSTSHILSSILQESGLKVGLYTSPHLKDFAERIRINGNNIDHQYVVDFVNNIKPYIESRKPSFFEITTALAFQYFEYQKVDVAVIETGLGGRLDSTNIINPLLSIITNIGFDHTDLLGDTYASIAFEKAGIIKKNTPVIINEYNQETLPVFTQKAKEEEAPLYLTDDIEIRLIKLIKNKQIVHVVYLNNIIYPNLALDLTGKYQLLNLKAVIKSVEILKEQFQISEKAIYKGCENIVANTNLKGRWQILNHSPLTVCDTAHNVEGISKVLETIAQYQYSRLHIVLGMAADKDYKKVLDMMPKQALYYFTQPLNTRRALPKEYLYKYALSIGLQSKTLMDVNEAIAMAQKEASTNDMIVIVGSNFLIAEIENL